MLDVIDRCSDASGNIDVDKIPDDDIDFTITPVDVTTYTQSSYSYYYGTSSSTVVTKIAPAISYPALAKLLLNKAKITITYSKQSLF